MQDVDDVAAESADKDVNEVDGNVDEDVINEDDDVRKR